MKSMLAALLLAASPAWAADPTRWLEWRDENAQTVLALHSYFTGQQNQARAHKALEVAVAALAEVEERLLEAAALEQANILAAHVSGAIDATR